MSRKPGNKEIVSIPFEAMWAKDADDAEEVELTEGVERYISAGLVLIKGVSKPRFVIDHDDKVELQVTLDTGRRKGLVLRDFREIVFFDIYLKLQEIKRKLAKENLDRLELEHSSSG